MENISTWKSEFDTVEALRDQFRQRGRQLVEEDQPVFLYNCLLECTILRSSDITPLKLAGVRRLFGVTEEFIDKVFPAEAEEFCELMRFSFPAGVCDPHPKNMRIADTTTCAAGHRPLPIGRHRHWRHRGSDGRTFRRDERTRLVGRRNLPGVSVGLRVFPICKATYFLTNLLRQPPSRKPAGGWAVGHAIASVRREIQMEDRNYLDNVRLEQVYAIRRSSRRFLPYRDQRIAPTRRFRYGRKSVALHFGRLSATLNQRLGVKSNIVELLSLPP
ncbi:MAG: hypothetical protein KJ606_08000 [Chloroflexi bacterium]|nr:hypothetical protein [Chloroflexota bacterium]